MIERGAPRATPEQRHFGQSADAARKQRDRQSPTQSTNATLAIDIGGTKLLVALVDEGRVLDSVTEPTDREGDAQAWVMQVCALAERWRGRYARVGVAVTGVVNQGLWNALNPATLAIPVDFPLQTQLETRLQRPVTLVNDAQAAAWGEYCYGGGRGRDLVFITVSTGIGGGAVLGGRLWQGHSGLAGNVGQWPLAQQTNSSESAWMPVENSAAGRWIGAAWNAFGGPAEARDVFAQAVAGDPQAIALIDASAAQVAQLCAGLNCVLNPAVILLGGGVGLADGYRQRVQAQLACQAPFWQPVVEVAALGANGGIIGAAALAITQEKDA